MMRPPYKFPKVARPQNGIFAKQDLAMLEDPKTRHAAMKTLKGYIRRLDEESLPYFLDSLCQSKEHGPQRTLIISLYEDVARIHGKLLIPHIATIMTSITHTLESSGSDFQLHSRCAKAMKTIASSCIDSATANQQAGQILQCLSECLLEPLVSTFQPVAGGAAFCLRLLAEVDAWRYLPEAIVNELLIRLTFVLSGNTTVNHLELARTLAKTNRQMLDMYALAWLGSGIKVLQCMTNEWKHRLASVQLISAILNSVEREKLFPGIDVVVEALERSRYDKIPKVRTAVSEALHSAKAIATECEKFYEGRGGRKGSSDMLFVLATKLKKQFQKASSLKRSRHTPRTSYPMQDLSSKPSSSCVACIRKLDDRHHKTSNLEYSNQYNGHILHLRPIKRLPHLEGSEGGTSEQAGLHTSKGYNSSPKCPTPTRAGSTAISVKCSIVDNDFKDLYSFDDVLCKGAVNVVVMDSETEAMPGQSLMSSNNTTSGTNKEGLGSVDSKIVDEVENLFWSCITNLNTLPEVKDVSDQDWRLLPLDIIQGPLNCIFQLDFLDVDDDSEIEHDKENQESLPESETEFIEEHSSSLSETTTMVKRYKKSPSETTEMGKNNFGKMDMDAYSETEREKEHRSPVASDKEHQSPPSETSDMVKSHAKSPSWTTDMGKDKIVKMDEHAYNGSIWNMRHNPIADSITEDDIPVLSMSRTSTVYRDALIAEAQKADIETAEKKPIPIYSQRVSSMYEDALNAGAQQSDPGAIKDRFNFESVDRDALMAKAEKINLRTTEDGSHLEYMPSTRIFNIHDDALMVEVGIGTTEDSSNLESTIISKDDFPSRRMPSRRISSVHKDALILEDQKVNTGTSEGTANLEMSSTKDIFGSERIPFRRMSDVCEAALMKKTQKIDVGTIEDSPIIKNAFHSRRTPNVMTEIQNIDITNREDCKTNKKNLKTTSDAVQIPVRSSTSSSSKFSVLDSVDWRDQRERRAAVEHCEKPNSWYMRLWGSIFPVNSSLCKIAGELYSMVYSALEGFLRVSLFFVILVPIAVVLVRILQSCNEYELLLPT